MRNYLLLMTLLSCGSVFSQNYNKVASMNEQGEITVKEIQNLNQKNSNLLAPELTPFLEFGAPSHFIKNTRGLTLRSEEHTSELQSRGHLVCRLLLEKKKKKNLTYNKL